MPFLVPLEGEVYLLTGLLGGGTLEDWTLKLYQSNTIPSKSDTATIYTEANFTNYAAKTLTRSITPSTWNPVVSQAPSGSPAWSNQSAVGHSQYGSTPLTWSCGAVSNTVYGYYIVGVSSGKLIAVERFDTPRTLANGDTLSIIPVFELS